MKKIVAAMLLLLSLFLVSCDIGAELESYSDQLMSQVSEAAGSLLKEATPPEDDKSVSDGVEEDSEKITIDK